MNGTILLNSIVLIAGCILIAFGSNWQTGAGVFCLAMFMGVNR